MNLGLAHYLYLPFDNNDGKYHVGVGCLPMHSEQDLELIGAQYMLACFAELAFNRKHLRQWPTPVKPEDMASTQQKFAEAVDRFIDKSLGGGVLVHLGKVDRVP